MRPLDHGFVDRVLATSLAIVGLALLPLLSLPAPHAISLLAGFGSSAVIWKGAQVVGGALSRERWRARDVARLVAIHFGKYLPVALGLWLLSRGGLLSPMVFAAGATVPLVVVFGKAVTWTMLPAEIDPRPYYARVGKAAHVD